jgi:excinuclease ABC subunit C
MLLQRIRDEAHRFAINFHRDKRSKGNLKSTLEDIPGIGKETSAKLLKAYKSVKKIKEASIEDVANIVGKEKAHTLKNYLA